MKRIFTALLLMASASFAAPPEALQVNLANPTARPLTVFQSSAKTYRVSLYNNGTTASYAFDGTGYNPAMYWSTNTSASNVIPASCTWVSQTGGVFDATFSPSDMNWTNAGTYFYGVGVVSTSSAASITAHGDWKLILDPYAAGAAAISWTAVTNLPTRDVSTESWSGPAENITIDFSDETGPPLTIFRGSHKRYNVTVLTDKTPIASSSGYTPVMYWYTNAASTNYTVSLASTAWSSSNKFYSVFAASNMNYSAGTYFWGAALVSNGMAAVSCKGTLTIVDDPYSRGASTLAWYGPNDAPSDGTKYGRLNGAWSAITSSTTDPNAWHIGDVVTNAIDALARSYTNQAQSAYDWINAFVTNDLLRTAAIATWTEGDLSGVAWASFVRTNNPALSDARAPLAHNQPLSTITNAGDLAGSNYTATANAILATAQGSGDGRYVRSDSIGTNTVGVDFSSTIMGWDGPINTVGSSYTSGQFLDTWWIPGYEFPDILPSGFHRWSSAFPISIVVPPYYVWGSNNIALDWRGFRSDYDATGDTDVVNYRTMVAGLTGKVGTNDSRLTDARTPLAHTQDASTISNAPWWVSGTPGDGSALTGVVVSVVESDPIFTNWVATNVVVATESDPVYTSAVPSIVFTNSLQATNSRPTTSTLEDVVANGGTVAGNAVTIDAANARTNTYGGGLVKLGPRIQAGSMVNASTNNTIALGVEANALHANSFIWNSGLSRVRNTSTNGQFSLYADGGFLLDGGAVVANGVNLGAGAANGNTAYGWGNHAGLYDVTGAAVSVSNALAAGAAAGSVAYAGLSVHTGLASSAHAASAISTTSSYGNVEAAIAAIGSGTGDNLGNHTATMNLNFATYSPTNYGAGDSFLTPTVLTSASTVTITRAHLNRWSLRVTNSPCTITFQMADWHTNGSGFCRGDIFSGTNSMILDATTIRTNANYPISFSTADVTRLMFDRPALAVTNKFDVRP